jgi:peptidoglycan/LPS O-acetylase OafA/YrhL
MSVLTRAELRRGSEARPTPTSGFRGDIQGLRGVAVLLVLLYHAGLPFLPGGFVGVDVFFVLSGFLITGLIVREIESTGRLRLGRFYARRARRLLPATAVVFVAVALITLVALPVTRWETVAGDLVAASLYVVNWTLAGRSVDYLASASADSPLQHFWSLAVEEQFYVLWPLLIVLVVWLLRRLRGQQVTRGHLAVGLLVIAAPSLVWSWHLTATEPGPAYFVTTTRLWELAVGALLAVGAERVARVPQRLRTVLGWVGLAAIALAAWRFDAGTPFPGLAALAPTLGAAAVVAAGLGAGRGLLLLRSPALQDVGTLSYSLYLWHWPLLVGATAVWGDDQGHLGVPTALLVVGFSAVPAWLAYRLVENPMHHSRTIAARPWRAAVVAVVCVAIGLGAAGAVQLRVASTSAAADGDAPGGAALGDDPTASAAGVPVDSVPSIVPALQDAAHDNADPYRDGCHQNQRDDEALSCTYGDADSDYLVALVGDSHAVQWEPALREIAEENGWRLDTYSKSACLLAEVDVWISPPGSPYESCRTWGDNVLDALAADPPDLVITSESGDYPVARDGAEVPRPEADPLLAAGLEDTWAQMRAIGSEVVVLVDPPYVGIDVPECAAQNPDRLTACAVPRQEADALSARSLQQAALDASPDVRSLDMGDYVCPQDRCSAVIGGVLVYRDKEHLTATYARSLAEPLEERLAAALG